MWNPIALAQANAVLARGVAVRWRDFKATARDVFAPVYIVFLLVILKLLVGEESLPAVPELPPVRSDCAPVDAAVSPRAVCWHYPTRTPLEKTLAYAPANHPAVDALMRDVLARVEVSSPHPRSSAPVILQGFDDAAQLLAFYRAEPHKLYAGVLFPRLLDANADGDWDGDRDGDDSDSDSSSGSLRVDEPFSVLVNGSYVPPPRATSAGAGDACRPLFRPDDTVYDAGARGGRLPTFCGSMTFLSAGVTHVQSAVASALGARALGASSTGDDSYAVDLSFAQAPLGAYERSFGSLTMRLFASVYLTLSLASLLGASANQTSEDRRTRRRAVAESAGLLPSAYWAGTAALLVGSFAFSATCLVTVTVFLGLFGLDSFAALTLLAVAFSTSLASLGFLVAAAARSSRDVGVAVGALQLLAPALFVPLTYFGGSGAALTAASLLSPVAFAASMDVAVQAEAGRDPLTLANFASRNVGRDVASGGAGGTHPLTAAGAFGMMVFDAALYAALAWYAETARAWRDPYFFARRRFWRGSPIFGNAFGDSDAARHVAVEMGDPTRGGRYEVLDEDALANDSEDDEKDEEDEDWDGDEPAATSATTSATTSAATAPRSRLVRGIRRRRARLVTSIKLEDVRAEDDAAEDDVCDDDVHVGSPPRGFLSSALGLVRSSRRRRRRRDGGSRRRAVVDGVTVSAHDGQVLALLGHAGSGASETLEVMSGRRPRSAGAMEFRGAPVAARWSPVELGASVGLCPSRDALEGLLTPREHLAFAARLHRQTTSSASASAMNGYHAFASAEDRDATEGLLREAGLGEGHAPNAPVEGLDPGARRALQVAMAFVGAALPVREEDGRDGDGDGSDSASRGRVVLLDDPTGDRADPATRRATWAMIRAPRAAPTTVVIVTRSVAEATAVADRVAVISHGRVKCCGGLTFLRKLYGLGYRLHVALAPEPEQANAVADAGADADAKVAPLARDRSLELLDAVRRRVPEAELARDPSSRDSAFSVDRDASESASQSVVVSLADHAGRIGALLADLESDADRLGVRDVAVEATSLEEAFARLGQESRRERETVPNPAGDADLDDDLDVALLRADERDVVAGLGIDATNDPASAFDRPHGDRPFGFGSGSGSGSWFGLDASDGRNAFVFFKSRLRARARRPGSSASLYLTPALVALALCAAQVASSARSSAVSESFLARATWEPPDASSSRGVGAGCAGSARADCGAAEFGSAGVGEVVPVTFTVAADASEAVAEDARAIMRASFDGADPSSAERADGDAPADYAGTAPLPGPGGLHVRFNDADLRARRVAASVIYDPLTDVHVLPRVVSEFHTAFARAAAAAAAASGFGNASDPGSGAGSNPSGASSVDLSATLVNLPQETPLGAAWSYLAAIAVPIAMCAFPAAAVSSAVAERVSSTRLTLALAGLSSRSYWAATFAADAACGTIGACAAAIAGSIVGVAPWDPAAAPAMLASLLASIPSSFALAYVVSFRHDDAAHASSQTHFFLVFFAFLLLVVVASMEDDSTAKRKWHFAASAIVPSYAALGNAHIVVWRALSDDNGARAPVPGDYFRGDRGELVAVGAFGAMCGAVAWGLALVAAEAATRRRLRAGSPAGAALAAAATAAATDAAPSPFVAAERERVERFARRASNGASRDSSERPRDRPQDDAPSFAFAACGVSAPRPPEIGDDRDLFRDARAGGAANVWFGVEPGEIVCVVGSRDSGKEALARCAAGMDPFAGDALFADGAASARRGGVAALAAAGVGACLRDDAFVDETATPLEHLELVAAFRGARNPARVAREIAAAAGLFDRDGDPTGVDADDVGGGGGGVPNALDFSFPNALALAETPLRALDASARRRTSLAAATVGDPAVLILDAPTRLVDSSARRRVWRRLADHARRGGAVLASTDALDEAEAIASRVVAMADGRVVDLGTPRQLKARHGAAYTLKVQLRGDGRDGTDASSNPASREDAEATHALVASAAPAAAGATAAWDGARECRYELAAMRLPELARLCATLDAATGRVVEGYTLSQPTLAQTFLHLSAGRDAERGRATDPASGTYAPGGGFPTGGRRNGGV